MEPKQAHYIITMLTKQKAKNRVSHGMISFFSICDDDGDDRMCWNHHTGIFDGLTHGRFRGNHAFVKHHLSFCSCPSPDSVCVCLFVCLFVTLCLCATPFVVYSPFEGSRGRWRLWWLLAPAWWLVDRVRRMTITYDDDEGRFGSRWGSRVFARMDIRTKHRLVNVGIVFFFRFPKTEKPTKHTNTNTNTKHIQ